MMEFAQYGTQRKNNYIQNIKKHTSRPNAGQNVAFCNFIFILYFILSLPTTFLGLILNRYSRNALKLYVPATFDILFPQSFLDMEIWYSFSVLNNSSYLYISFFVCCFQVWARMLQRFCQNLYQQDDKHFMGLFQVENDLKRREESMHVIREPLLFLLSLLNLLSLCQDASV